MGANLLSIDTEPFAPTENGVLDGCVTPGINRVMRVDFFSHNLGPGLIGRFTYSQDEPVRISLRNRQRAHVPPRRMLDSLDTVIGFVVIILVVSLLITIVVQMVSTALNLRGKNLARGLALTLDTAVSGSSAAVKAETQKLTDYILQLPHLADSRVFGIRRATAVRPQEVHATLTRLAGGVEGVDEKITNAARAALEQLGAPPIPVTAESSARIVDETLAALRSLNDPAVTDVITGLEVNKAAVTFEPSLSRDGLHRRPSGSRRAILVQHAQRLTALRSLVARDISDKEQTALVQSRASNVVSPPASAPQ